MSEGRVVDRPSHLWHAWVDRRGVKAVRHRLHHKNLFVLPTAAGWSFLLLALVIWLLGTNYQNNLILALSYLQLSLLVVVILHTYNNLSGLSVECLGGNSGHAGQNVVFKLQVSSTNTFGAHSLIIGWRGAKLELLDVAANTTELIDVKLHASERGPLRPPSLLLRSDFPLGLVKCWTWLQFDAEVVVYPEPIALRGPVAETAARANGDKDAGPHVSGDEFFGYREYRAGDSPRHIAWKQYARDRGLYSKQFGDQQSDNTRLHWQHFFKGDVELALSQMTYCTLDLHQNGRPFALSLPSADIPFGRGDAHLARALRALALHGKR